MSLFGALLMGDGRWEMQLHRPLRAAAYYLNTQYHYSPNFKADYEVKRGLYGCLERLVRDSNERNTINLQLEEFKNARGLFGISAAKAMREEKTPAES
ncbi:HAT family dimerization domain containing protein [Quillaja saponaria]|uniref:HAT family dimerization domain containing protein n=1 Tax=Quillaja saponaria TaxID=32244 RepID=A0AAD7LEX7_QUISA|nr:HAT family dimerization domain containing protein [Quillaja saponaria]